MRDEIKQFAEEMERIMSKYDKSKGDSWKKMTFGQLLKLFYEEQSELVNEFMKDNNNDRQKEELVDMANILMMLWSKK